MSACWERDTPPPSELLSAVIFCVSDVKRWRGDDVFFPQLRELFLQVQELFLQVRELCEQVRDLWGGLHALSSRKGEDVLSRCIGRNLFWRWPIRACIYVNNSPKKHSPPSHRASFLLIFNGFLCEGLDFKAFTRRWTLAKDGESKASNRETASKPRTKRHNHERAVWIFEKAMFHTKKHWKSTGTNWSWSFEWFLGGQKYV